MHGVDSFLPGLFPWPVQFLIVIIAGLVLGSFATALVHRIPLGRDIGVRTSRRSQCTACGHVLGALDLVPFFSWLFLRGRCRYCAAPIAPMYPLVELGTLVAALGAFLVFGFSVQGWVAIAATPLLLALLAIDMRHFILPDVLVGGLFLLGLLFHGLHFWEYIMPAFGFAFILWLLGWVMARVLKKEALGFGDVKFFGVCGLWLGGMALAPLCLMAGGAGVLMGLVWRFVFRSDVFPFGPALIISFYACLLLRGMGMI